MHQEHMNMKVTAPPSGALQGGVNMALGQEVALNDAERLLLEQKKKALILEEKIHDVYTGKNIAEKKIRELNQVSTLFYGSFKTLFDICFFLVETPIYHTIVQFSILYESCSNEKTTSRSFD